MVIKNQTVFPNLELFIEAVRSYGNIVSILINLTKQIFKGGNRMQIRVLYPFMFLMLIVFNQGAAWGAPTANCSETNYQTGEIDQGTTIVHDFAFKNTGDEPLTVKVNDCGCDGSKFKTPATPIRPGNTGIITVSIPTKYRKGDFRREIKIETNDPGKKEVLLSVSAKVIETLSITPQYIDFGQVKRGSSSKRTIQIANNGKEPFTFLNIEITPSGIAVIAPSLDNVILRPGNKKSIDVTLTPQKSAGLLEGALSIKTNSKLIEGKKIHVRAEVTGD